MSYEELVLEVHSVRDQLEKAQAESVRLTTLLDSYEQGNKDYYEQGVGELVLDGTIMKTMMAIVDESDRVIGLSIQVQRLERELLEAESVRDGGAMALSGGAL